MPATRIRMIISILVCLCAACHLARAFGPAIPPPVTTTTSHTTNARRPLALQAIGVQQDEMTTTTTTTSDTNKASLEGCICLVTGASRGIGKGIALELGSRGATVYVTGTSSSSRTANNKPDAPYNHVYGETGPGTVEETAEQVTAAGGKGIAVYCNHAVDEEVEQLLQRIGEEQDGRLDILINNAFRMPRGSVKNLNKKFWEQEIETWDSVFRVGLRSHYVASYYAMPLLLKSAQSTEKPAGLARPLIGMIGSFGGLTYTFNLPYGVGKSGVDRLAKDMAIELTDEDICVVSFWPGLVMTERTEIAVNNGEWEKNVGIPLDDAESPALTGKAVVALATDPENMQKTGSYQVVAELAEEYGFCENDGSIPPSIRSLRYLIPNYGMDEKTREKVPSWLIPDWKLPFWVMAQGRPPPPKEE